MSKIALIGNPNCGKTTLFNILTGSHQRVGNRTGVTTEGVKSRYTKNKSVEIIDLPGLYSITTTSKDELAVSDYLKNTPPDVIINIVDGTNLERNLYLTTEILKLGIPTVLAVNMIDDLEKNGVSFNTETLSKELNVPVVPISALKNKNVNLLIDTALSNKSKPKPMFFTNSERENTSKLYEKIAKIAASCVNIKTTRAQRFTLKADNILTNKYLGLPIFFVIMCLVYFLSFSIGGLFSGGISAFFNRYSINSQNALGNVGAPNWLSELVTAIINGVGSVMEFMPQILVLFLLLALLEESGYTSRVAFNLDRLFRVFGLGGKSVIPLILSCGCTVSGLMATRTIENEKERIATIMLVPFMPCGAKFAVFGWFSYAFFDGSALVATSLFFLAIFCVCVFGVMLRKSERFGGKSGFLLEMPTYRVPSLKSVFFVLWEKIKEFVVKAGTVMLAVSVLLWLLTNFGIHGYTAGNTEDSFLYYIGSAIKYLFYPLGFGNWQSAVAILSGSLAKEAVIETLGTLCENVDFLFYSKFSVYAFLAFVLISPPCLASVLQAKRELKSNKVLLFMLFFQTLSAYIVALTINLIGILFEVGLIFVLITVIIITIFILSMKMLLSSKKCIACKAGVKVRGGCKKCRKT